VVITTKKLVCLKLNPGKYGLC